MFFLTCTALRHKHPAAAAKLQSTNSTHSTLLQHLAAPAPPAALCTAPLNVWWLVVLKCLECSGNCQVLVASTSQQCLNQAVHRMGPRLWFNDALNSLECEAESETFRSHKLSPAWLCMCSCTIIHHPHLVEMF